MQSLTRERLGRFYRILAGLFLSFAYAAAAVAQVPTAEQIQIFQNLPPDQQQAILEAIGRPDGTGVTDQARPGEDQVTQPGLDQERMRREVETQRRTESGEIRLAPDDTLIVEILPIEREGQERILTPGPEAAAQTLVPARAGVPTQQATGPTPSPPMPAATATQGPADANLIERTEAELAALERMMDAVRRGNPYRITRPGTLDLPGLAPIPVAGLTVYEATQRLTVERVLQDFRIRVTLLPLEPPLRPFGYDLFTRVPSTFAPVGDIPVPADYVVGPGDRLEVQLVGNTKARYSLTVNRDGNISFPELGPIAVSGMRFEAARARIQERVSEQMIGTQASVSMSDLRTIRVFVVGEVEQPGSYTVGGLAAISNALLASGGVKPIGSLRDIQLKRNGRLLTRLDLYDLLLNGDASNDARLQTGDVIFIPPVGVTVGISGEVRRPAIYELKGESTAGELVRLAGGLTPDADPALTRLERVDGRRERVMVDVDLASEQGRAMRLYSGDVLRVERVKSTYANSIEVTGHVLRPSVVQYRAGLRLTDVIRSVAELKPNADQRYVLIRREQIGTRRIQVVSADLAAAWQAPDSDADPLLAPRDRISVFDLEAGRQAMLDPILDELRLQAVSGEPSQIVRVSGRVNAPGDYPLEPGMTVTDLIRAGGGLAQDAYGGGGGPRAIRGK